MNPNKILSGLENLKNTLQSFSVEENETLIIRVSNQNAWFTEENILSSVKGIASMLKKSDLEKALNDYCSEKGKRVGVIMAGNIPAVGFQDLLYVLLSGGKAFLKYSSQDEFLMKYLVETLIAIDAGFREVIEFTEKLDLDQLDAVIATGSDNTSRYFEQYFAKIPHVIRKNRTSVAVLDGNESLEDLQGLAKDITQYFGLGCRNVTKLFVPEDYDLVPLLKILEDDHKPLSFHSKYNNNYDYYKAVFLVNSKEHLDNGMMLFQEQEALFSPVGVLYYQKYKEVEDVKALLSSQLDKIQVAVSAKDVFERTVDFGKAQNPSLFDFPDGENIFEFLSK